MEYFIVDIKENCYKYIVNVKIGKFFVIIVFDIFDFDYERFIYFKMIRIFYINF